MKDRKFSKYLFAGVTAVTVIAVSILLVFLFLERQAVSSFFDKIMEILSPIIIGAVFDFFDGMTARLLGVSSPIGKELDSLADCITFGFAPSAIIFSYLSTFETHNFIIPFLAFIMAAFSALRLAKFNLDERQHQQFIGLPTPANALFWGSLVLGEHAFLVSQKFNAVFLFLFMLLFCMLLVCEVPMLALKFKNLSWADNKQRYVFLVGCLPLLLLGASSLAAIIVWYVAVSIAFPRLVKN